MEPIDDAERRRRKAAYQAAWYQKNKHRKCTGRPSGRARVLWPDVADPRERRRLHSARQFVREGAKRVERAWRFEPYLRQRSEVIAALARDAYSEWLDAFDDELPAGVDLSAALWGSPSS